MALRDDELPRPSDIDTDPPPVGLGSDLPAGSDAPRAKGTDKAPGSADAWSESTRSPLSTEAPPSVSRLGSTIASETATALGEEAAPPDDRPMDDRLAFPGNGDEVTRSNLDEAVAVLQECQSQLQANALARLSEKFEHEFMKQVQVSLGAGSEIARDLHRGLASLEEAGRRLRQHLLDLQAARQSLYGPLHICERRLEQRASRPEQELIRDVAQEALEREHGILLDGRDQLANRVDGGQALLQCIEACVREVHEDLSCKRHTRRIDRTNLLPEHLRWQNDHTPLHEQGGYSSGSSPRSATSRYSYDIGTPGGAQRREAQRDSASKALLARASGLVGEVNAVIPADERASQRLLRACAVAASSSTAALHARIQQCDEARLKLEQQIAAMDGAVAATEASAFAVRRRLRANDVPLEKLKRQRAMRDMRCDRENLKDTLQCRLEEFRSGVRQTSRVCAHRLDETTNLLDRMRAAQEKLQGDWRCKQAALRIDRCCLLITMNRVPLEAPVLPRPDTPGLERVRQLREASGVDAERMVSRQACATRKSTNRLSTADGSSSCRSRSSTVPRRPATAGTARRHAHSARAARPHTAGVRSAAAAPGNSRGDSRSDSRTGSRPASAESAASAAAPASPTPLAPLLPSCILSSKRPSSAGRASVRLDFG